MSGIIFHGVRANSGGGGVFPPFPLNSADNGLSVDPVSGKIVLGGAAGFPSQLLDNREIDQNGNQLSFLFPGVGSIDMFAPILQGTSLLNTTRWLLDPMSQEIRIEDTSTGEISSMAPTGLSVVNNAGAGDSISIKPNSIDFQVPLTDVARLQYNNAGELIVSDLNTTARVQYWNVQSFESVMGDIDGFNTGFALQVMPGGQLARIQNSFGRFLSVDAPLSRFTLGDMDATLTGWQFDIDGNNNVAKLKANNDFINIDVNNFLYQFGDVGGTNNGSWLEMNGSNDINFHQQIGAFPAPYGRTFELSPGFGAGGLYTMGDIDQITSGAVMQIDGGNKQTIFTNATNDMKLNVNSQVGLTGAFVVGANTLTFEGGILVAFI